MNAALNTLLAKLAADVAKDARNGLTVGKHPVNETIVVHVTGTVTVGEDYSQKIVLKADPWTLLQAALSHLNGVTVQSLVKEALTADPALLKSIKAEAEEAMASINAPTLTACKGKVTIDKGASLTIVSAEAEDLAQAA